MNRNREENSTDEVQKCSFPDPQIQAFLGEMRRLMKVENKQFQERLDKLEMDNKRQRNSYANPLPRQMQQREHWCFNEEEEFDEPLNKDMIRSKEVGGREDNNLGSVMMKIPPFQGRADPETYLEWERKVELVFDCHNYSEQKKVRLASIQFSDYALIWWEQLVMNRRLNRERLIESWAEMKVVMKKRFVPSHYYRALYKKLQGLEQGNQSVEEYYQEMKKAMVRANVEEDPNETMERFMQGLNQDIADLVVPYKYINMEHLIYTAIRMEKRLKRRGMTQWSAASRTSQKEESQKGQPQEEDESVIKNDKIGEKEKRKRGDERRM